MTTKRIETSTTLQATEPTDASGNLQQGQGHGRDGPGQAVRPDDTVGRVLPEGPEQRLVKVDNVTLRRQTHTENRHNPTKQKIIEGTSTNDKSG